MGRDEVIERILWGEIKLLSEYFGERLSYCANNLGRDEVIERILWGEIKLLSEYFGERLSY